MAFKEGIFPLSGTIGNVTFSKGKGGKFEAGRKTSLDKERILSDSAFLRTRENNTEFAKAARGASLIRTTMRLLLQHVKDKTITNRLFSLLMKVIKADTISLRGQRNIVDGNPELLEGFDFNTNGALKSTLYKDYTATINRVTGDLEVVIPQMRPYTDLDVPEGATHFQIVSGGYEVDFETGANVGVETSSAITVLDNSLMAATTLTNTLAANSTKPLFLALGVKFFQQVNGAHYPLMDGKYTALSIVKVDKV